MQAGVRASLESRVARPAVSHDAHDRELRTFFAPPRVVVLSPEVGAVSALPVQGCRPVWCLACAKPNQKRLRAHRLKNQPIRHLRTAHPRGRLESLQIVRFLDRRGPQSRIFFHFSKFSAANQKVQKMATSHWGNGFQRGVKAAQSISSESANQTCAAARPPERLKSCRTSVVS